MSRIALGAPAWPALDGGWSWWVVPVVLGFALGVALSQRYRWSALAGLGSLAAGFFTAIAIDALGVPIGLGLSLFAWAAIAWVVRMTRRPSPPRV